MFPPARPRTYPFDRLLIVGMVALLTVPLVIYAWIAVVSIQDMQVQFALEHTQGACQLMAEMIDQKCTTARRAVIELATRPETAANLESGDPGLAPRLRSMAGRVRRAQYGAVYDSSGALLRSSTPNAAPLSLSAQTRLRPNAQAWFVGSAARVPSPNPAILVAAPVRRPAGLRGTVGYVVLAFRLPPLPLKGASLYLADEDGWLMATTASSRIAPRRLGDYPPMRFALHQVEGASQANSPDEREEVFAGYAPAGVPRWGVVVTQPLPWVFSSLTFLGQKLSLLLVPIFGLASAWAWTRVRSARQIEALAGRLSEQNEQLRAADRARSLLLANVSHDLRTPLACIRITLSGLNDSHLRVSREHLGEALQSIDRSVDDLAGRVSNLLEMSRLESGAGTRCREPGDLTAMVASALDRVSPLTKDRRVEARFPAKPLLVECDQAQIETVLVNLVDNAVKYSPEGSVLHLSGWSDNGWVGFSLRDEGAGFAAEDEERVFEKFYRSESSRSVEGTGLGLAICKAIVEAHGGRIRARTQPGSGAEISFTLPALTGATE